MVYEGVKTGKHTSRKRDYQASCFAYYKFGEEKISELSSVWFSGLPCPCRCDSILSINHLLIITALPAHNEKVQRPNIAPVVVYEIMITHLHLKLFQTVLSV